MTERREPVASGLDRRQADDVVLLLAALAIEGVAVPEPDGRWSVAVDARDAERARAIVLEEDPAGTASPAGRPPTLAPRATAPPIRLWTGRGAWAVLLVIVVCVLWFLHMNAAGHELSRAELLHFGAITWDQVWVGERWRLVSAIFVHFDGAHIVTNMITLLIVGPPLAALLGPWRFLLIFLLTGIAGNWFSYLVDPTASLKAGASGAIAGVLGALGGTSLDPGWGGRFKRWQVVGALVAVYAMVVGAGPERDNAGHLGGLLAGIVLGRLLTPRAPGGDPAPRDRA